MVLCSPYLDQEEGHSIGFERASQLDIADFGLNLRHVLAVLVGLLKYAIFTHNCSNSDSDRPVRTCMWFQQ